MFLHLSYDGADCQILHTVQSARNSSTPPLQAEMKLRNVNMFLNGLVSTLLLYMNYADLLGFGCRHDRVEATVKGNDHTAR
jgi:hypothetical protein